MAVVFISPRQRQKVFFMIITTVFVLILVFISLGVFLSKPEKVSQVLVFNKPKVNIDMKVFDSDEFKNLYPFSEIVIQFSYDAITEDGRDISGFISAVSATEAQKILESTGLTISSIKEVEIGRNNPFTPYYQDVPVFDESL